MLWDVGIYENITRNAATTTKVAFAASNYNYQDKITQPGLHMLCKFSFLVPHANPSQGNSLDAPNKSLTMRLHARYPERGPLRTIGAFWGRRGKNSNTSNLLPPASSLRTACTRKDLIHESRISSTLPAITLAAFRAQNTS